jgi:hypothetical protein
MVTSPEDGAFGFLLRSMVPFVLDPLGLSPSSAIALRGVVRTSHRARVAISQDSDLASGVAVEFELGHGSRVLDVEAAVRYLQSNAAQILRRPVASDAIFDSHHNVLVNATAAGFGTEAPRSSYDQSLFGLFSILVHGGGFPWFEDVLTFDGFMFPNRTTCRVYLRIADSGRVVGIEVPLLTVDGQPRHRFAGSLPQELASLVRAGDLLNQPQVDQRDEYCAVIFDMSSWV